MKQDKANITVDIKGVKKDDAGFYELITNGGKSFGELIVTPKPPVFNAAFTGKPTFYTTTSMLVTDVGVYVGDNFEMLSSDFKYWGRKLKIEKSP